MSWISHIDKKKCVNPKRSAWQIFTGMHSCSCYVGGYKEHCQHPRISLPFHLLPPMRGNDWSKFCHHKFILPVFELHIKWFIHFVMISVWLLSLKIRFVRFIHVIVCSISLFNFIDVSYLTLWIYHSLFFNTVNKNSRCRYLLLWLSFFFIWAILSHE